MPFGLLSDFDAFSDADRVFELNAQIARRAVHFAVAQQKLNCTQVTGLSIDQSCLGAAQGMCPIPCGVEPDGRNPFNNKPRILPCRQV